MLTELIDKTNKNKITSPTAELIKIVWVEPVIKSKLSRQFQTRNKLFCPVYCDNSVFAYAHKFLGLGEPALIGVTLDDAILALALCLFRAHNPALVTMEAALLLFALFVARIVQIAVTHEITVLNGWQLLTGALLWSALGIGRAKRRASFTGGILIGDNGHLSVRIVDFDHRLFFGRGGGE